MMLVRTYLSNSSIEGIGVFAADPIRKGDLIWRLDPKFDVLFTDGDVAGWPAAALLSRVRGPGPAGLSSEFQRPWSSVNRKDRTRAPEETHLLRQASVR